ncbi:class I SAM-dependent methyltransferase [Balneolaceae bacterium]|nr:class I SAM-dependent methyltransferase [Balneolaceae bacterium]
MIPFSCPNCSRGIGKVDKLLSKILDLLETKYRVRSCDCGMKYLWPRVEDESLSELYSSNYFSGESLDATPESYLDTVKSRHFKFKSCLLELIHFLPKYDSNASKFTFLDVGAGTGDMVHLAQKAGFHADGLEFSSFARTKAKEYYNLELLSCNISDLKSSKYDVIHTNHVFEHFNNPLHELRAIHKALKITGILYIEIPRQFHFIELMKYMIGLNRVRYNLHSIHHPFFYTEKLLCNILRQNNFRILKSHTLTRTSKKNFLKVWSWKVLGLFGIGNVIEVYSTKII